jgi:hypothetical protein
MTSPKKISYSQYSLWANCPKAWQLKYVDGHRLDDSTIHTVFGTVCHETIPEWLDVLYNKSEVMAKTMYLHDEFKEKLIKLFKENVTTDESGEKIFLADKKTLMEFYEHGCLILSYLQNNYKKIFPTENTKLHSIEFPLEMEVRKGVQYIGYVDIITHNTLTNTFTLYDLKTSRSGWSDYQKKDPSKIDQLLLYKRFFSQQMGIDEKNISIQFIILKRTIMENAQFTIPRISKFEPSNGQPSVNKSWDRFQKFIDSCFSDGEYVSMQTATPSKDACRWCKFKDKKELCSVGV